MVYLICARKCLSKQMAAESLSAILLVKQNRIGKAITRGLNSTTARKSNWHETSLLLKKRKKSKKKEIKRRKDSNKNPDIRWWWYSKLLQFPSLGYSFSSLVLMEICAVISIVSVRWVCHPISTFQTSSIRTVILKCLLIYNFSRSFFC